MFLYIISNEQRIKAEQMDRIVVKGFYLVVAVCMMSINGCALPLAYYYTYDHDPGIAIYEMPSFKKIAFFPNDPPTSLVQIIHIDENQKIVKRLIQYSNKKVVLQTIGFNGCIINEMNLPILKPFVSLLTCDVSPDGKYMVYQDFVDSPQYKVYLCCIDLQSLEKSVLSDDIPLGCREIHYISNSKIALVINDYLIIFYDIQNKTYTKLIIEEGYKINSYEFSKSKKYLAYIIESPEKDKKVKVCIIDTGTLKVIAEITEESVPSPSEMYFYWKTLTFVHWSPDEKYVAYLKAPNKIVTLSIKDPTPRVIHEISEGYTKGIGEFWILDNDNMYYIESRILPIMYAKFRTLNIKTGEINEYWRMPCLQGKVNVVEGGKLIISKVGPINFD